MDINFILLEFRLALENVAFQGVENRHVDDRGAGLAGALGDFIDLAQQLGRNGQGDLPLVALGNALLIGGRRRGLAGVWCALDESILGGGCRCGLGLALY
ncbi:hypothetical protein ACDP63_22410 [Paracoccus sp. P2]|uniref:hypothetical protein n=1 Tax=Paracoccus sp. P2 TaxID=3248840 RepID=UPI00391F7CE6